MLDKQKFRGSTIWKHKRAEILARDNNKCKICGNSDTLQVHHIYSLDTHPDMRLENNNLITLCDHCHHNAHNFIYSPAYLINKINET